MKKIVSLIVIFCLLFSSSVSFADTSYKYNNGYLVRWTKPVLDICIKQSAYHLTDIVESVRYASNLWNSIDGIPKTHVNFETANCDIFIDYTKLPSSSSNYLASNTITNMWDGSILYSEIQFNTRYSGQFGSASANRSVYDIKSIVCHELGHALGLEGEPNNTKSVMYEYTGIGEPSRRRLTQEDIRSIKKLYSGVF